jgi:hypothetical protein
VIKSRRVKWSQHGRDETAYKTSVRKPEGNQPLGRPRFIWDHGKHWIRLDQDRDQWDVFLNMVMELQVPQNTGNFLIS